MTAAPQSTPALPPLPEPGLIYMGLTGGPEHAYSADQLRADRRQIVELCAQLIESQTMHRRRIHAACNSEPVKPCEMAAALRSLLAGEPK